MDNKKLLQILLRDVTELEDIISGVKNSGTLSSLEGELLYTRISGVKHMLELVSGENCLPQPEKTPVRKQPEMVAVNNQPEPVAVEAEVKKTEPPVEPVEEPKSDEKEVVIAEKIEKEPEAILPAETAEEALPANEPEPSGSANVEFEEESVAPSPSTFGERFSSSRSINDLLTEHSKSDLKFDHMPVGSLQSSIGINDKFLFTRELFNGDADAFGQTIRVLDAMSGVNDAAAYLRENFKWKKTDTSLKFIDLVKRRFL